MSAAYSETLRPVERKAKFLYYGASQMLKYRLFSDPRQRSFAILSTGQNIEEYDADTEYVKKQMIAGVKENFDKSSISVIHDREFLSSVVACEIC